MEYKITEPALSRKKDFYPFYKIIITVSGLFLLLSMPFICSAEAPFYSISLGFSDKETNAGKQVDELLKAGHKAFYREEIDEQENTVYRIYIEKYSSKEDAESEARILKELDLISDYSVREVREKPVADIKAEETQPALNETLEAGTEMPQPVTTKVLKPEPEKKEKREVKERRKIEIPATKPEPDEIKGSIIRVGSFRDKENMDALLKALIDSGYNAFYRYEDAGKRGNYYRLYIGGYETEKAAREDAEKLKETGVISDYIINPVIMKEQTAPSENKTAGNGLISLHVSSYRDEKNAQEEAQALIDQGLKAFFVKEIINEMEWYRVYIGGFADEEDARKSGGELMGRGIISYFKPFATDKKKTGE